MYFESKKPNATVEVINTSEKLSREVASNILEFVIFASLELNLPSQSLKDIEIIRIKRIKG